MGLAWYRKVPYISEEKPKGYLVIPRQNQKTGQKQSEAVCIPIREAAIKIYGMYNPNFIIAGSAVGRYVDDIAAGYILRNEYLTKQFLHSS